MFITTGDKGSGGLSKAKVYRSVDSSVPSILPPWFESQVQHQYFYQLGLVEKTKINKEARIGPFFKNDLGIAFMAKNSVSFFAIQAQGIGTPLRFLQKWWRTYLVTS